MPTRNPKIKAISFDGDGTLWDYEATQRRALGQALAELQRLAPAQSGGLTVETMAAIRQQVGHELGEDPTRLEELRLEAFTQTLRHIGIADEALAGRMTAVYMEHRFKDVTPFDDVVPTLDALQGRFVLGVLSNGNSHPDRFGLAGRFRFIVFAQQHGVGKPNPRLFEIALREAGCRADQLLHVGDSLEHDVLGAQGAGIRSVWLDRDGKKNSTLIRPAYEISSLLDLVNVLRGIA